MLIGCSPHGKDDAGRAIKYLLSENDKSGRSRSILPVVVRGDPAIILELTRSSPNVWKYTSGVISWAPGEVVPPEREVEIMNEFEQAAFAGLELDQYSILWVRHQHAGHHELHFITPRLELRTRKSLNIAPPGKGTREIFDALRSWINAKYGYADPDDPKRARTTRQPSYVEKLKASNPELKQKKPEELRELIDQYLGEMVAEGLVRNRADVITALKTAGFEINRSSKSFISVRVGNNKPVRLKGTLYEESFRADVTGAREFESRARRFEADTPVREQRSLKKLLRLTEARAEFNRKRYQSAPSKVQGRPHGARAADVGMAMGARNERRYPDHSDDHLAAAVESYSAAVGAVGVPDAVWGRNQLDDSGSGEGLGAGGAQRLSRGSKRSAIHDDLNRKGELNGRFGLQVNPGNSTTSRAREEGGGGRRATIALLNQAIGKCHEVAISNARKVDDADRKLGALFDAVGRAVKKAVETLKKRFFRPSGPAGNARSPKVK